VELWELTARESIRDLVARYNANGDAGRFDQVVELFAEDARMEIGDGQPARVGREAIRTIFTGVRDGTGFGDLPVYLRHCTSTLQIDLVDQAAARSRCYFFVLTDVGLDHWGRYVDEYVQTGGVWRFASRKVTTDGHAPDSRFRPHPA
jgi:3-phenylpropionate/cinnamic acid dioxygenase small subunit